MYVELIAITPDPEKVIEKAGRTCYSSDSKIEAGSEKHFVRRIIKIGHHSLLEHACAIFRITGVSRAFTHQLVRHRLCSFSQRSQRYVNENNFAFIEPASIARNAEAHRLFQHAMAEAKLAYRKLQGLGIKNEDASSVLPNAVASQIVVSANFRQLRHMFCLRCDKHAQWEMRNVMLLMLRVMKNKAPSAFEDFEIDEQTATAYMPFPS